jgi:hypothetical protein
MKFYCQNNKTHDITIGRQIFESISELSSMSCFIHEDSHGNNKI